jgi:DNA-binding CsgD family transcriptional regulator
MPDIITDHERAAIAAYTGPVQRIPRGVSGFAFEPWNPGNWKRQHGIAKSRFLRDRSFAALRVREEAPQAPTPRQVKHAAMAARQAEVRAMVYDGRIYAEIAAKLRISECTVVSDVAAMRKAGGFPSTLELLRLRRRQVLE